MGLSENNRRAHFYAITRAGRRQLAAQADQWARTVAMIARLLSLKNSEIDQQS